MLAGSELKLQLISGRTAAASPICFANCAAFAVSNQGDFRLLKTNGGTKRNLLIGDADGSTGSFYKAAVRSGQLLLIAPLAPRHTLDLSVAVAEQRM